MENRECRTMKQKFKDFGQSVKRVCKNTVNYLKENKEVLLVVLPLAGAALGGSIKLVKKVVDNHRMETIKRKYIYDPSGGFYWPTRRALTGREKLELDERHRAGESYGQILTDMRLLKL
jgi:hypothetical protein